MTLSLTSGVSAQPLGASRFHDREDACVLPAGSRTWCGLHRSRAERRAHACDEGLRSRPRAPLFATGERAARRARHHRQEADDVSLVNDAVYRCAEHAHFKAAEAPQEAQFLLWSNHFTAPTWTCPCSLPFARHFRSVIHEATRHGRCGRGEFLLTHSSVHTNNLPNNANAPCALYRSR